MNVEPMAKTVLAGVNIAFTVAEAKVIKDMIGPYSQHEIEELGSKPDAKTANAIWQLYHQLDKIFMES